MAGAPYGGMLMSGSSGQEDKLNEVRVGWWYKLGWSF